MHWLPIRLGFNAPYLHLSPVVLPYKRLAGTCSLEQFLSKGGVFCYSCYLVEFVTKEGFLPKGKVAMFYIVLIYFIEDLKFFLIPFLVIEVASGALGFVYAVYEVAFIGMGRVWLPKSHTPKVCPVFTGQTSLGLVFILLSKIYNYSMM